MLTRRRFHLPAVVTATLLSAVLVGCSATAASSLSAESSAAGDQAISGAITVFAAASLKNAFTELGESFQGAYSGTTVTFSFAGSSDLVTQVIGGAPADVFASADTKNMTKLTDAGLVNGALVNFATNTLTIVTPPENPAGIASFADLAKTEVALVVCAPEVPCGSATEKVETAAGVTLTPVSEESSVTDVLNKVTSGEADAGLVYLTDAAAAGGRVTTIAFPESSEAVNTYPIAVLKDTENAAAAAAFTAYVAGPAGQEVLRAAGFAPSP